MRVSVSQLMMRYLDEELCDKAAGQALKGRRT